MRCHSFCASKGSGILLRTVLYRIWIGYEFTGGCWHLLAISHMLEMQLTADHVDGLYRYYCWKGQQQPIREASSWWLAHVLEKAALSSSRRGTDPCCSCDKGLIYMCTDLRWAFRVAALTILLVYSRRASGFVSQNEL